MIKSIFLYETTDSIKANLYINELNSRGIYAFINSEHTTDIIPFVVGGYRIHVNADQFEDASELIDKLESGSSIDSESPEYINAAEQTETIKSNDNTHKIIIGIMIVIAILFIIKYSIGGPKM